MHLKADARIILIPAPSALKKSSWIAEICSRNVSDTFHFPALSGISGLRHAAAGSHGHGPERIRAEDGKTASITIYQIRFVPQMPVTIDVTIPNVAVQSTPEKILLSCETTVPLAMGGEFPRYSDQPGRGNRRPGAGLLPELRRQPHLFPWTAAELSR